MGRAGEAQKKDSRKGKLNEKKFHARQITLRNNHAKDLFSKRTCFRKQFLRLENPPPPPDNFSNCLSLLKSCGTPVAPVAPAEDEHPLKIFTSLWAAPFIVFHCSMRHNRTSYTVNRIEGKWKFQIRVSFSWFYFMFLFFCNSPHTVQLHTTKINLLPGGQYSRHIRVAVVFALVRPF